MTMRDARVALMLSWPFLCLSGIYLVCVFQKPAATVKESDQAIKLAAVPLVPTGFKESDLPPEPIPVVFEAPRPEPLPPQPVVVAEPLPESPAPPLPVPSAPQLPVVVLGPAPAPPSSTPAVTPRGLPLPAIGQAPPIALESAPEIVRRVAHVEPLPPVRKKAVPAPVERLPLVGCYTVLFDPRLGLVLPRTLIDKLGQDGAILVSPGTATCLWLTTPAYLDKLTQRMERIPTADVPAFRRLFFAQAEKVTVEAVGRLAIPERLAKFAELNQEVVLIGVEDHIEVWDAARWRQLREKLAHEDEH